MAVDHLKNSMVTQEFDQSEQRQLGKITIKSRFGELEEVNEYMVINMDTLYTVLLGRPWMYKNAVVPSTYHQCFKYPLRRTQGTITADNDHFSTVETYHVDSRIYKANGKGKADNADIPTVITDRHPLAGFTHPMTSFECGKIDTYHCLRYIRKGEQKGQSSLTP